jgi:hypothetical protein
MRSVLRTALGLALASAVGSAQKCPSTAGEVANMNPLTSCLVTPFLGLTADQAAVQLATDADEKCVGQKNACNAAVQFNHCQSTTESLIMVLVPPAIQTADLLQCPNFFKAFPEYCGRPFGELISLYCPDPPLLPLPAVIGICAGGVFLIGLTVFVCWRTRRSILLDQEIEAAVSFNSDPPKNRMLIVPPQKATYKGVEWNASAGGWDAIYQTQHLREWLGTFQTQEQAAMRYDQKLQQMKVNGGPDLALNFPTGAPSKSAEPMQMMQPPHMRGPVQPSGYSPSSPGYAGAGGYQPPAYAAASAAPYSQNIRPSQGLPAESSFRRVQDPDAERHMQELVEFYLYHDPDKPDIQGHVRGLFEKYNFKGIARAILRKYGVLPTGWSSEYDATRSIAVSMAAKFFSPTASMTRALAPSYSMPISPEEVAVPKF